MPTSIADKTTLYNRQERLIRLARQVVDGLATGGPGIGQYADLLLPDTPLNQTEPIPTVIERADAALYRAKQSGRNRVEIYDTRIT